MLDDIEQLLQRAESKAGSDGAFDIKEKIIAGVDFQAYVPETLHNSCYISDNVIIESFGRTWSVSGMGEIKLSSKRHEPG